MNTKEIDSETVNWSNKLRIGPTAGLYNDSDEYLCIKEILTK
jgi:hypothetical protein